MTYIQLHSNKMQQIAVLKVLGYTDHQVNYAKAQLRHDLLVHRITCEHEFVPRHGTSIHWCKFCGLFEYEAERDLKFKIDKLFDSVTFLYHTFKESKEQFAQRIAQINNLRLRQNSLDEK